MIVFNFTFLHIAFNADLPDQQFYRRAGTNELKSYVTRSEIPSLTHTETSEASELKGCPIYC